MSETEDWIEIADADGENVEEMKLVDAFELEYKGVRNNYLVLETPRGETMVVRHYIETDTLEDITDDLEWSKVLAQLDAV